MNIFCKGATHKYLHRHLQRCATHRIVEVSMCILICVCAAHVPGVSRTAYAIRYAQIFTFFSALE